MSNCTAFQSGQIELAIAEVTEIENIFGQYVCNFIVTEQADVRLISFLRYI